MAASTIWGFFGDFLSFAGALILALDALLREREFVRQKKLMTMIKTLKEIRLTLKGIELVDEGSTHLVFIRQSVRRSVFGASILTLGFVCLFICRWIEVADRARQGWTH